MPHCAPLSNTAPVPDTKEHTDGKLHAWAPGCGRIEDSGGGSIGIVAEDMYENGREIGSMRDGESSSRFEMGSNRLRFSLVQLVAVVIYPLFSAVNYIAGQYAEMAFPSCGTRFTAVSLTYWYISS